DGIRDFHVTGVQTCALPIYVLAGLIAHEGPILVVANWDGTYPGLVGALNLVGSLTKADVEYSFLWSKDFSDVFFNSKLKEWLETDRKSTRLNSSHVKISYAV